MICSQHVRLDEVCQRKTATSDPSARPFASFSYVDIASINTTEKQIDGIKNLLGADAPSRARRLILTGDVLVSMTRPNLNAVAIVPKQLNEMVCSTGFAVLRPGDRLLANYLFQYVQSPGFVARLSALVSGAMYPAVTERQIRSQTIPLPPVEEQRRIVEILNHANRIRRLRREVIAKARELIPALFIQMFGDPLTNPKGWEVRPLVELALVVSGVAKGRRFNGKATVSVPYIRVANVQAGKLDLTEIKNIEALPEEVRALRLLPNDVLLTEGGDHDKLGRGAMWESGPADCIHQNHVFRVRCSNSALMPLFFLHYLQTDAARSYFLRCAKRTTNLASINMTQLRALPVPVPLLPLQQEFAKRVRGIQHYLSQHEYQAAKIKTLHASLLAHCFA